MIALYSINIRIMAKGNVSLLRVDTVFSPLPPWAGHPQRRDRLRADLRGCGHTGPLLVFRDGDRLFHPRDRQQPENDPCPGRVKTDTMIILGLVISNGLVAFAGALIGQFQSYADIQMGIGSIVIGLASVIIGEVLSSAPAIS